MTILLQSTFFTAKEHTKSVVKKERVEEQQEKERILLLSQDQLELDENVEPEQKVANSTVVITREKGK